jgi:hypothetical protein
LTLSEIQSRWLVVREVDFDEKVGNNTFALSTTEADGVGVGFGVAVGAPVGAGVAVGAGVGAFVAAGVGETDGF